MKSNFKTKLLLGAAVTALSFGVAHGAYAQDVTLTADDVWQDGAGDAGAAADGNSIDLNGWDLTVDDNTDADGGGDASISIGAITDSAGADDNEGDITITGDFGTGATTAIAITSIQQEGDYLLSNSNADNVAVTTTVAGNMATGANFTITNAETTNNVALTTVVNGNLTVDGATTITASAGDGGGANAVLTVGGNATFTGDLDLNDDTGEAIFNLNGSSAQTVTGNITGDGHVAVDNAAGATFAGTVTATEVDVEKADGNSAATFQNTVAAIVTLGGDDNADDENTVTFNTTPNDGFAITGTLDGNSTEVDTVVISGDDALEQDAAWGGGATGDAGELDVINVTGTATLDSDAAITATTINVGSTAKLDQGAGLIQANVANSGTIQFTGTGNLTGNVTGTGSLDVDADTTITGNVAGTSANIATGADLTIAGANEYSVTNTTLVGGAEFETGTAAQTLSGNFLADADGDGTITITNANVTTTITGNIGTSALKVGAMTFGGGAVNTVTTTGNLYVDTITLDDQDILQFTGNSSQIVDGDTGIVAATAGDGIITLGTGTSTTDVTFNSVIGTGAGADLNLLNVAANAVGRFNANATFDGAADIDGTIYIGPGATVQAQNLTGDGTVTLAVTDADTTNALAAADFGRATDETAGGTTLTAGNFAVDVRSQLATGRVDNIITNVNLADDTVLSDNSFQYTFTTDNDDAVNTDIIVTRRTLEDIADGSQLTNGAAETLDGLIASTDTEIAAINANLAAASSQEAVNDILESVSPTVDAGAVVGATGFTTQTSNITNTQLASLRDGTEATGMYAGNVTNGLRGWVQGFGLTGDQDERDGVSGYDVDSYGVAVGLDTQSLADNWIWGLAFAYSDTDVDSDGVNNTNTDIDNYQVSVYANYDLDDRTYIAGQAGYVWGDNDQTRYNVGGVSGLTADADYDSDVIFAGLEAGRKYMVGGNTVLTPKALINYQHYDADGYTETGAGGANLTTSGDELDLFEIGVGVDASWDYQQADGSYLQPKIGVGVRHDLVGDEYQTTSTFAAGGSSFETEGFDPAQTTFNVSADVTYFSTTNWELSAGYDFEIKSDYDSHAGTLKAAYKF